MPEFGQHTLEVLRQPLEDKIVTISRAQGSLTFPAVSVHAGGRHEPVRVRVLRRSG
jgi:magnesium chelatase family protein